MKKISIIVMLLITTLTVSFAQNERVQARKKSPEQRTDMIMQRLNEQLGLNKEQFIQIRKVVLARELKRERGKHDKNDRDLVTGEINKYLTKEQKEKWNAIKKERHDKKHDRKKVKDHHNESQPIKDDVK